MIKENSVLTLTKRSVENNRLIPGKPFPNGAPGKIPTARIVTNQLLAAQPDEIFREILPHLETVSFAAGDYLYQPGDQIDFLYFPETAIISEFQILEDGRTVEIAMTGGEGLLGLLPMFNSGRATNWTQVSLGGSAVRINAQLFEKQLGLHPGFQKILFEYVNNYVAQISQRSVCNSYHVIEQRFCSWLLMLQERKRSNKLSLTQEQIARSLGVHRPSLTHIAQNLRSKKIIDYVRGKIYILNRPELEKSACPCFSEIGRNTAIYC